jgi:hypothetical protein
MTASEYSQARSDLMDQYFGDAYPRTVHYDQETRLAHGVEVQGEWVEASAFLAELNALGPWPSTPPVVFGPPLDLRVVAGLQGTRRYCWRVGGAVTAANGSPCPECGSSDHKTLPAGVCGEFVEGGMLCNLAPGHDGAHVVDRATLTAERDAARAEVADLQGEVAELEKRIAELEDQVADLQGESFDFERAEFERDERPSR